ncbi:MAG TPA: CBS domain-containing protein [Streptosporangiaceae bacterium]
MSRKEEYLQSMLRDLGSVYYQTLQGEASEADVARAVETVRSHKAGQDTAPTEGSSGPQAVGTSTAGSNVAGGIPLQGRWRVADVMATDVVRIGKDMPYKQVARVLAENGLSAVPVTSGGGHVLGIVSEADVLRKEERAFSRVGSGLPRRTRHERQQARAVTASELMTSPAITIHPDAPLGAAARLMNGHNITRLPVVNADRELIGMVSRNDLLSVFLRPDDDIAAEITANLAQVQDGRLAQVTVSVADGEVTLTGELRSADLISEAVGIASGVDGVVTVSSRLTVGQALRGAS